MKLITCINKNGYAVDDRLFKSNILSITEGGVSIMEQKLYESLDASNKPLKNRINVILTNDKNYKKDGCIVVTSTSECADLCKTFNKCDECYLLGSGSADTFLNNGLIDEIIVMVISDTINSKIKFPLDINNMKGWKETDKYNGVSSMDNNANYTIQFFIKRKSKKNIINLICNKIFSIFAP